MPTKNIVPRADKEGGLGRSNKRWSEINAYTGSFIGELSSSVIQTDNNTTSSFGNIYIDGVSTPLFSDFSSSIASRVVSIEGGGITGQAEAMRLGISRALVKLNPDHRLALKPEGLLTRDPRMVERKKPGQKKARKKFQFSKR